ncbi:MAG TPA: hypothetical protein P5277_01780 [Candidatus Paceibacterota bacterium]|nr:hypothetical protein [Candidatus Paceibacterota bacterium]
MLNLEQIEELNDKNVRTTIISIEAQLNNILPCGDSIRTHTKDEIRHRLSNDRQITGRLYGDNVNFIRLKKVDEIIYQSIIKNIGRAIDNYHCYF